MQNPIEILAVFAAFLSVYYSIHRNMLVWPTGLVLAVLSSSLMQIIRRAIYTVLQFCYTFRMNKDSLSLTNPYLRVPGAKEKLAARSVRTSCGVEGIRVDNPPSDIIITNRRPKKIYNIQVK